MRPNNFIYLAIEARVDMIITLTMSFIDIPFLGNEWNNELAVTEEMIKREILISNEEYD